MRTIIVRSADVKKVLNIKGYIEMRLRKVIDKLTCQIIEDDLGTVVFHVRTSDERFAELKQELDTLYPSTCIYLMPKTES